MFRTDFITHEHEDVYHAQSKSGAVMSSHMLSDFRNSPLLYYKKINGQIEETFSPAFAIGSATHKLILEGQEAFDDEYTVSDGPINERTGSPYGSTTNKFLEWAETQSGKIFSSKDFDAISELQKSVWLHQVASKWLEDGVAEGVARAKIRDVMCQIRMDWFSPEFGLIDLKTCAELRWFEFDARKYGYVRQLAFYRAVIREMIGETVPVRIIAVEKAEPFATGVWEILGDVLDQAEMSNNIALERYKQCKETDVWPTGYEELRLISEL